MSGGWESKSVEDQQAEKAEAAANPIVRPPAARGNVAVNAEEQRRRQALEMQRERILSERTSSPHRRSALTNALADIEEKLVELGWSVHL